MFEEIKIDYANMSNEKTRENLDSRKPQVSDALLQNVNNMEALKVISESCT